MTALKYKRYTHENEKDLKQFYFVTIFFSYTRFKLALVVELVDTPVLGTGASGMPVQVRPRVIFIYTLVIFRMACKAKLYVILLQPLG